MTCMFGRNFTGWTLVASAGGTRRDSPKLNARQNAQLRQNFKQALKAASTNESRLAESMGIARHTLTDIGRSESGPRLATLLQVATELGLYSVDELLGPSGTEAITHL
jgi:DNA-binding XRE family transcriptional regulator